MGKWVNCRQGIFPDFHKLTTIVNRNRLEFMNVNLGPTFDAFVEKMLKSGLYQSQSEILREGLRLLKEREELKQARLAELRREIAIGVEEADRREFVDGPKALAELRRKYKLRKTVRR